MSSLRLIYAEEGEAESIANEKGQKVPSRSD
jgi:hypothetical protein